jgi:hypothetical protein
MRGERMIYFNLFGQIILVSPCHEGNKRNSLKTFISPFYYCNTVLYDEGNCFTFPSRFRSPYPFIFKKCPFHRDFVRFFQYSNINLHIEFTVKVKGNM